MFAGHNPARWPELAVCVVVLAMMPVRCAVAQSQSGAAATPAPASAQGVVLDRVVAVVNGEVILESDVDEERRFEEIQPYREAGTFSRDRAIQRLIDRRLILQQAEFEPEDKVTDAELNKQLATLRKDIPACRQYDCQSDAGWAKYLGDHGFTVEGFAERWRQRMELLRFIEMRFRSGITISD